MKLSAILTGAAQLLVELGPAIVFMASYNIVRGQNPEEAIFIATGIFMVATVAALAFALFVQKRMPTMLFVSGALILLFGGLTLWLKDDQFIKVQPTIVNGLFATALIGGMLFGRNLWKLLFQSIFKLPDAVWNTLAWRWAFFYIFLAGLNEFLWRTQSEAFWTASKLFVTMPLSAAFMLVNLPITIKWWGKSDDDYAAALSPKASVAPTPSP